MRFEDFVLDRENTLKRLENFLGIPLARIPVKPEAVGRYLQRESLPCYELLNEAIREFRYPAQNGGQTEGQTRGGG